VKDYILKCRKTSKGGEQNTCPEWALQLPSPAQENQKKFTLHRCKESYDESSKRQRKEDAEGKTKQYFWESTSKNRWQKQPRALPKCENSSNKSITTDEIAAQRNR
jgi:hypothetical protein